MAASVPSRRAWRLAAQCTLKLWPPGSGSPRGWHWLEWAPAPRSPPLKSPSGWRRIRSPWFPTAWNPAPISSPPAWCGWDCGSPPNRPISDHPYGHGRFEILTGLAIGMLLAAVGAGICLRSIEQRNDQHVPAFSRSGPWPHPSPCTESWRPLKMRIGKRARSAALTADAWHDLVDLFSGLRGAWSAVLLSVFFTGLRAADHYGGFAIGLIVIFLGLRVARETTLQLMDTMPDDAQMQQIRAVALRVPGALAIEKCFARKTGLRYHVDLHLEVDPYLTVLRIASRSRTRCSSNQDRAGLGGGCAGARRAALGIASGATGRRRNRLAAIG